jgi:hypothetical protein
MQGDSQADGHDADHANVWIFHGTAARFAAGVFLSEADGLAWAAQHGLTGILSEYPVGIGCYDSAVAEGRFRPTRAHHGTPDHIAGFSPGLKHVHLVDGTHRISATSTTRAVRFALAITEERWHGSLS